MRCRGGERVPFTDGIGAAAGDVCRTCACENTATAVMRGDGAGRAKFWAIPAGDVGVSSSIKEKPSDEDIAVVSGIGTLGIG